MLGSTCCGWMSATSLVQQLFARDSRELDTEGVDEVEPRVRSGRPQDDGRPVRHKAKPVWLSRSARYARRACLVDEQRHNHGGLNAKPI